MNAAPRLLDRVELGIRLRDERPGEHRTACPRCAETKHRPRDDALAVKVEPDGGATWTCHRCAWKGSTRSKSNKLLDLPRPCVPSQIVTPDRNRLDTFGRCRPVTPDCPAGRYLLARGCALPPPAGDLRWHPSLKHPCGYVGPALVALVTHAVTGEMMTLHRTWLAADGSGKAPVDKPRLLMKGQPKKGGVVRLWPDAAVTTGLCVAEGIETALTAARGFGLAWAAIDAANLAAFPLLDGIEALTVAVDHDRAGLDAFNAAAARWVAAGREVIEWLPPEHDKDINDWAGEAA